MDRYDLGTAMRRLNGPLGKIKEVLRYSDVRSVSIDKWESRDNVGKPVTRFSTRISSSMEDSFYGDFEEED